MTHEGRRWLLAARHNDPDTRRPASSRRWVGLALATLAVAGTATLTSTAAAGARPISAAAPCGSPGVGTIDVHALGASLSLPDPECPTATPQEPTVTQAQCTGAGIFDPAVVHIPVIAGVVYSIDGTVVSGDVIEPPGGTLTVVATPADGFQFDGSEQVPFALILASPECLVAVKAARPDFIDNSCTALGAGASFRIPAAAHVAYTVDGATAPPGAYPAVAGSTIVVVALPDAGFTVAGQSSFRHTFRRPNCHLPGNVRPVTFTDPSCTADGPIGGSFTVPTATGVVYTREGKVLSPGVHSAVDRSTVTIVAKAGPGAVLTRKAKFRHVFPAAPSCGGAAGSVVPSAAGAIPAAAHVSSAAATTVRPAATGAMTGQLVLVGLALIALGAGTLMLAARIQRGRRCA